MKFPAEHGCRRLVAKARCPFCYREHLFYIQSFSFWEAQNAYYTRRKNLDSYLMVCTYAGKGRLERAKELLRTTALPANKICLMVGINDENYFYRLFKKHVGTSPHKYRKS